MTTFDLELPDGSGIPIEMREETEMTHFRGLRVVVEGINVRPFLKLIDSRLAVLK